MTLTPLPLTLGPMTGLSERLMRSHHVNNYGGAVQRLNAIREQLASLDFATAPGFVVNGLKREELLATNSMLLHELYFASLGGDGTLPPAMEVALGASYGSVQRWRDEFVGMGRALSGGSGWVLLSYLPREGRLVSQWAADHMHALASGTPVLALDMYEHAYHLDYGAAAADYVDAFMAHIDGPALHRRFAAAVHAASDALRTSDESIAGALVLDVRRAATHAEADTQLPGAQWRDPAEVDHWQAELPRERRVVVYCAHGLDIGRNTALRLRAHGVAAGFVDGGIDGWQSRGQPLQPRQRGG